MKHSNYSRCIAQAKLEHTEMIKVLVDDKFKAYLFVAVPPAKTPYTARKKKLSACVTIAKTFFTRRCSTKTATLG